MRLLAALSLALCLAGPAAAREVRVPIRVDDRFLRELLLSGAFTDPEQTAVVYTDGVDCKSVILKNLEVRSGGGAVTVRSDIETKHGTLFLGICLFRVDWSGKLESRLEPRLDEKRPAVRFVARDTRLLEADGREHGVSAAIWEWLEPGVTKRLERLEVNLESPMSDLRATLPLFLREADAARAQRLVDSLRLESVAVREREVELVVRVDAGEAAPLETGPEPELSPEEQARFGAALSRWDGFITYVVKHAGTETTDSALRDELFEVLLDSREELADSLASPTPPGTDPVRPLFLSAWRRLSHVMRELGAQAGERGVLRYLGFIAASDALAALDELGPEFGFEMTSDGLRRLARVLAPADPADPLDAPEEVDPELRRALDFGEPLAPPELDEPAEPVTPPEPQSPPPESLEPEPPTSYLERGLRAFASYLFPSARAATGAGTQALRLTKEEQRRLRGWAPQRRELNEYLPLMRRLLGSAAEDALAPKTVALEIRRVYLDMQLATAWQETCWRHYVRENGRVIAIRSHAGAVGVMQVNSRVWRGFYDPRFLLADPAYNARAGSEILVRYYLDLAYAKGEQRRPGGFDDLVRATYGAYNGGPSQLSRYRNAKTPKSLRAIDAAFFKKYRAVKAGRELEVMRCFG
jgi:hypothetical protein